MKVLTITGKIELPDDDFEAATIISAIGHMLTKIKNELAGSTALTWTHDITTARKRKANGATRTKRERKPDASAQNVPGPPDVLV